MYKGKKQIVSTKTKWNRKHETVEKHDQEIKTKELVLQMEPMDRAAPTGRTRRGQT
jgi:hypothetical protein